MNDVWSEKITSWRVLHNRRVIIIANNPFVIYYFLLFISYLDQLKKTISIALVDMKFV